MFGDTEIDQYQDVYPWKVAYDKLERVWQYLENTYSDPTAQDIVVHCQSLILEGN